MKKISGLLLAALFLCSCEYPAYVGKFEALDSCLLFDHVEIYADKTADLKFRSIGEAVNWELKISTQEDTILEIRDYSFIYRNDSLIGNAISTIDCICIRKSLKEKQEKENAKTTR